MFFKEVKRRERGGEGVVKRAYGLFGFAILKSAI
jgi:hypothetical protein